MKNLQNKNTKQKQRSLAALEREREKEVHKWSPQMVLLLMLQLIRAIMEVMSGDDK